MIYYLSNIHFSSTGPVAVSLCLSGVPAVLASVDCSLDESPPATTTGPPYPSNETAVPERREQSQGCHCEVTSGPKQSNCIDLFIHQNYANSNTCGINFINWEVSYFLYIS